MSMLIICTGAVVLNLLPYSQFRPKKEINFFFFSYARFLVALIARGCSDMGWSVLLCDHICYQHCSVCACRNT